jgi:hypothetical protein
MYLLLVTLPCSSSLDLCWTCSVVPSRYVFSNLPSSSSLDLCWTYSGVPSRRVFSLCLAVGPWTSSGLAQVFLLLMCCHFALVFVI